MQLSAHGRRRSRAIAVFVRVLALDAATHMRVQPRRSVWRIAGGAKDRGAVWMPLEGLLDWQTSCSECRTWRSQDAFPHAFHMHVGGVESGKTLDRGDIRNEASHLRARDKVAGRRQIDEWMMWMINGERVVDERGGASAQTPSAWYQGVIGLRGLGVWLCRLCFEDREGVGQAALPCASSGDLQGAESFSSLPERHRGAPPRAARRRLGLCLYLCRAGCRM